jgi:NADPH:quinone reductase
MIRNRVWRARTFGLPEEVLRLEEEDLAPPAEGRMIVRVAAAGIGLPDVLLLKGAFPGVNQPPVTPGQEVAGEVVEVAPGSAFAVGERVMGMTPFFEGFGGCGDFAYVNEAKAVRAPASLTDEEAAGFLLAFRTAHAALVDRVPVQPGQAVVVLGAAGSSGAAGIQLAKALGAQVIAVAGGQAKCDFCLSIGADVAIDHRAVADLGEAIKTAVGSRGADVLLDPVGGESAAAAAKALGRGGRVAMLGYASGTWLEPDPLDMVLRNYGVIGVFAGGYTADEDQAAFRYLVGLAEEGRIRTPLGRVSNFGETPAAVADLQAPPPGKSVISRTLSD